KGARVAFAHIRQHAAVEYLTDHVHEAPVWIVACLEETATPTRGSGASIYPAVQNMLLAARALGLGATLTTRHLLYEKEAEVSLGLPPGAHSDAILPIGYPMGTFGRVGRGPLTESVYQDHWGSPYQGYRESSMFIKMIHHVNVQISDRERTRAWYEKVLGAEFLDRGPALNKRQLQLRLGSGEIHFTVTPRPTVVASSHFAIQLDDCQPTITHLD